MKTLAVILSAAAILAFAWAANSHTARAADTAPRKPVLVELFTSEGCSSCPPADALLQTFDRQQPIAGADLVVMSEHVDYWNQIGWKDPYSSHFYSDRQSAYANRFGLNTVYTPQMVVDGESEFTGSESAAAEKAIEKALRRPKLNVKISALKLDPQSHLRLALDIEGAGAPAEIFVAIALDHAQSQVLRGENAGRALSHTSVVNTIQKVGEFKPGEKFSRSVDLRLNPELRSRNLRVIAFVQQPGMGKVVGLAQETVSP